MKWFKRVLVANRGEIAVRVAKTLQQLGIAVIAVYSEPDKNAVHLRHADEAYPLEGTTSVQTYLRGEKIIDIAKKYKADAIHPGYGFLSENAEFAEACEKAGIVFIGPPPRVMRLLGDKLEAKQTAKKAGVPVLPEIVWNENAGAVREIGYPVLTKAVAGGGGKGVRLVREESGLLPSIEAARREARAAFGDDRIFIEKYLTDPRHIEFQIFGDHRGNVVHLFERECSIQRRYQKITEESPSPALSPGLRKKMGDAAVRIAGEAGYVNAGTVEFLLDRQGNFYFLEANTRLQVEHPVTEMTTGYDLVSAQVAVASGEELPFLNEEMKQSGHALECRIYAEDPWNDFLPSTGTIAQYAVPEGPGIRVDSGVSRGGAVTVHYDPMLAKLITHGHDRKESLLRMGWALEHYAILGISTNIEFLQELVRHPEFVKGNLHTRFLDVNPVLSGKNKVPDHAWIAAGLASSSPEPIDSHRPASRTGKSPWENAGKWRAF